MRFDMVRSIVDLSHRNSNDFDGSDDDDDDDDYEDDDDSSGDDSDLEYLSEPGSDVDGHRVEELDELAMQQAAFGGEDLYS
jgi:hypothetical protein